MESTIVTLSEIELAKKNGTVERVKNRLIDEAISRRYPYSAQIAILRQKEEKPEEYAAFYAYAEECKARVRAFLNDPVNTAL